MRTLQSLTLSRRRRIFLLRPSCILGLLVYATLCGPIAHASEVYAYKGFDYTGASGIYTTNEYIFGDFTTATRLPPNLSDFAITPLTFAFGDGFFALTDTNATIAFFRVTTDSYGTVTAANIQVDTDVSQTTVCSPGPYCSPLVEIIGAITIDGTQGDNTEGMLVLMSFGDTLIMGNAGNNAPGRWGPQFDPPSVPEPASAVLTSLALLALAFRARKQIARGIRQSTQMHR